MSLLPDNVVTTVNEIFGDRGRQWLADLPSVIAERCAQWQLEVLSDGLSGGTHSYVARVRREDGSLAALKITVVEGENFAEPTALHHYDGGGAVKLYEYDSKTGAMLMEYAQPGAPLVPQAMAPTHVEGYAEHRPQVELACRLYRRLWRPLTPDGAGFPTPPKVTDVVSRWAGELRNRASVLNPELMPPSLVARAVEYCAEFSVPDGPEGLVNRDTHLGNIVSAQREPWLLIDPKPLLGERAFDAGYLTLIQIESRPERAFADDVVAWTADWLGVNPDRVRGWAFIRTVEDAIGRAEEGEEGLGRFVALAKALT